MVRINFSVFAGGSSGVCVSFTEQLSKLAPSDCPHLILQAMAGPLAAATASTVTNPMDVVRARVQVSSIFIRESCDDLGLLTN